MFLGIVIVVGRRRVNPAETRRESIHGDSSAHSLAQKVSAGFTLLLMSKMVHDIVCRGSNCGACLYDAVFFL